MEKRLGVVDKVAASVVGLAFFIAAMSLILLGFTFLPVIGVVGAMPLMAISLSFFHTESPKAQLDERMKSGARTASPRKLTNLACPTTG